MADLDTSREDLGLTLYTERDVERARRRGKMVGWVQGGGAVVLGGMLANFLGWIPGLLVLGVVAYGLYRLLFGGKAEGGD